MINKPSKMGITPVDRAAKHGFCVNLKLLLEAKADAEPRRKDNGATPLHGAAVEHYPNCCELLLQHGADVNGLDKDGNTPLHLAVNPLTVTGNPEVNATVDVIAILLKARARLDVMNNNKQTPIDLAIEHLLPADGLRMLQKGLEAESEVISVEV